MEVDMLVLSRKLSQQIMIGSDILITVVKIDRNAVRIGIEAPRNTSILRNELVGRQPGERRLAAKAEEFHSLGV
jgi:carbon storage regulator